VVFVRSEVDASKFGGSEKRGSDEGVALVTISGTGAGFMRVSTSGDANRSSIMTSLFFLYAEIASDQFFMCKI
jgi:hypothetical protein